MAGRRSPVTDIRELLRRLQLGEPDRRIARDLSLSRNTVARYRQWATAQKLLPGALRDPGALAGRPLARPGQAAARGRRRGPGHLAAARRAARLRRQLLLAQALRAAARPRRAPRHPAPGSR